MADLRADRHLDGLPDAPSPRSPRRCRSRCSSPRSGSSCAAPPTHCARAPQRPRATRASTSCSRSPRCSRRSRSARSIGAIASRRVPVGNAAGRLFSSWLNPTSMMVGVLAVATSAYLAAVFMAADAGACEPRDGDDGEPARGAARARARQRAGQRRGRRRRSDRAALRRALPVRAPAARQRAGRGDRLGARRGRARSSSCRARSFELARYSAALAVAAIVAGWALAQRPLLLPGLTVQQAAAPHDTLVLVVVAVLGRRDDPVPLAGAAVPARARGRLDHGEPMPRRAGRRRPSQLDRRWRHRAGLLGRIAGACLLAGFGFLTVAEAGWAHAIGVVALLGLSVCGFFAIVPAQLAERRAGPGGRGR